MPYLFYFTCSMIIFVSLEIKLFKKISTNSLCTLKKYNKTTKIIAQRKFAKGETRKTIYFVHKEFD